MPEVFTEEYRTRAARYGVTASRGITDLDKSEYDNFGRQTSRRERSVCHRLRPRFDERMHTRMYVCTYVCLHALLRQQGASFFCATNKRNDTILQVLFVDREQARLRSAGLHPEICRRRSCRLFCASAIST